MSKSFLSIPPFLKVLHETRNDLTGDHTRLPQKEAMVVRGRKNTAEIHLLHVFPKPLTVQVFLMETPHTGVSITSSSPFIGQANIDAINAPNWISCLDWVTEKGRFGLCFIPRDNLDDLRSVQASHLLIRSGLSFKSDASTFRQSLEKNLEDFNVIITNDAGFNQEFKNAAALNENYRTSPFFNCYFTMATA